MIKSKICIIGVGNMGEAILNGIVSSKIALAKDIYLVDKSAEKLHEVASKFLCNKAELSDGISSADVVVFAIKPKDVAMFFKSLKNKIRKDQIFISIVASLSINEILNAIGNDKQVVRVMPNLAAKVQASVNCIAVSEKVVYESMTIVNQIFSSIGSIYHIDEDKMDIVTGLTGSAPAFIFQIIEAMSDAAVLHGLPRKDAIAMAADTVMGAGKMVALTKIHPAILKDMVTSPAGTTIEGVREIERLGVRNAMITAVSVAIEKSKQMNNNRKPKVKV